MLITKNKSNKVTVVTFECDNCKNRFNLATKQAYDRLRSKNHYCTSECAYDHRKFLKKEVSERKQLDVLTCLICASQIHRFKSASRGQNTFCGKKCYGIALSRKLIDKDYKQTDLSKEKISNANKGNQRRLGARLSAETKAKIGQKSKERLKDKTNNPMYGKSHTLETKQKMSEIVSSEILSGKRKAYGNNGHKHGIYFSTKMNVEMNYRSSWELACMKWLDNNKEVTTYQYESIRIAYDYDDGERAHKRYYIPDFVIEFNNQQKEIWEIKPLQFRDSRKNKAKEKAALEYCKENNINEYKILSKCELKENSII